MQRRRQRGGGSEALIQQAGMQEKKRRDLIKIERMTFLNTLKSAWEQSVSRLVVRLPLRLCLSYTAISRPVMKVTKCTRRVCVKLRTLESSGIYKLQTGQRSLHNYGSTLSGLNQIYLVPVLFCLHFPLLPFLSLAFLSLTTSPLIFAYSHPSHPISLPLCSHYFLSNISVCLSYSPPRPVFCVVLDSVAAVNRTSVDTVKTLTALRLFLFLVRTQFFPLSLSLATFRRGSVQCKLGWTQRQ